jgi:hypothetical protein
MILRVITGNLRRHPAPPALPDSEVLPFITEATR